VTAISDTLWSQLRAAFLAEAANVQRYAYFAEVAEIEGRPETATFFRDLAATTTCAAHGHLDLLRYEGDPSTRRPIDDTDAELAASLAGVVQEATDLYPRLAERAHAEGLADVASWLETMTALKRAHMAKLRSVLAPFASADETGR
jgi:rubrerythrin